MTQSPESVNNGKGMKTLPLFSVLFLIISHNCLPTHNIFRLQLKMVFKVMACAILTSYLVF